MQFAFRFQILLYPTSVRFSTKTLAYLAYKVFKAFIAFKRSRLNPFQNYRSITTFSVDWPRTIRLVCVGKYFEIGSQLVVMVLRAQDHWVLLRNFSILWRRKKKDDKKQRRFMTGSPQVSR